MNTKLTVRQWATKTIALWFTDVDLEDILLGDEYNDAFHLAMEASRYDDYTSMKAEADAEATMKAVDEKLKANRALRERLNKVQAWLKAKGWWDEATLLDLEEKGVLI